MKFYKSFLFIPFLVCLFLLSACKNEVSFEVAIPQIGEFSDFIADSEAVSEVNFVEILNREEEEEGLFAGKTIKIVSWNIRHLGKTKTDKEIHQIAQILRNYDLVAVQEVVAKHPGGAQAVAKIADELNRMGFQWDYQVSDPTKSPSAQISERYAFFWKPSRVTMVGRAKLDKELEDKFFREPFVGKFRIKGDTTSFYVANYHSRKYSDKPEEEIIHLLDYPVRFKSDNLIIAGDFNTDEKNPVWMHFYQKGFKNALSNTPTTLKHSCKLENYRNHPIDNFYFSKGINKINADAIDFVMHCDSLPAARGISDHLPVYMEFGLN